MNTEVITMSGDLKRERWSFWFDLDYRGGFSYLYLDSYSFQTRGTLRQKWVTLTRWERHRQRDNTVVTPPLPAEVIERARQQLLGTITEAIKIAPVGEVK